MEKNDIQSILERHFSSQQEKQREKLKELVNERVTELEYEMEQVVELLVKASRSGDLRRVRRLEQVKETMERAVKKKDFFSVLSGSVGLVVGFLFVLYRPDVIPREFLPIFVGTMIAFFILQLLFAILPCLIDIETNQFSIRFLKKRQKITPV